MDSEAPIDIASTLQGASINRHPSPRHDINPSTAASARQPVTVDAYPDLNGHSELDEDEIPISVLDPIPRSHNMPPLPDLRFEQSYLKSIEQAEGWKSVAWITIRDQVIMCFAQGVIWTLLLSGWRHWNRSAHFSGQGIGAKIRRWWWGVNNWTVPNTKSRLSDRKLARNVSEGRWANR